MAYYISLYVKKINIKPKFGQLYKFLTFQFSPLFSRRKYISKFSTTNDSFNDITLKLFKLLRHPKF